MSDQQQKIGAAGIVSLLVSLITGIVLFYNQLHSTFKSSDDKDLKQRVEQLESKQRLDRIEIERLKQKLVP